MIPIWLLEIAVVVWGLVLLFLEAFAPRLDRRQIAFAGIGGLVVVLMASFFLTPQAQPLVQGLSTSRIRLRFFSNASPSSPPFSF